MILGLDVSTSITGITVVDDDGNIVLCEHLDTRNKNKFPDLLDKAEYFKDNLLILKKNRDINIDKIYIEQSLQAFRPGFSSAKTILLLSKFNGIVSWICKEVFSIIPEYVSASSARKLCGIKVIKGKKAKEVVLDFLLDNEPTFSVEYTKAGNPSPGVFDRADSLIIARAGNILSKR